MAECCYSKIAHEEWEHKFDCSSEDGCSRRGCLICSHAREVLRLVDEFAANKDRIAGVVNKVLGGRDFGFAKTASGEEYFIGKNDLQKLKLVIGSVVTFVPESGSGRTPQATAIVVIS